MKCNWQYALWPPTTWGPSGWEGSHKRASVVPAKTQGHGAPCGSQWQPACLPSRCWGSLAGPARSRGWNRRPLSVAEEQGRQVPKVVTSLPQSYRWSEAERLPALTFLWKFFFPLRATFKHLKSAHHQGRCISDAEYSKNFLLYLLRDLYRAILEFAKCNSVHKTEWLGICYLDLVGFPGDPAGKESACHAGEAGLIPGSGRSPGEGNGNPLQYSCLENSMDRGAWQATVHGITMRQDWTSKNIHTYRRTWHMIKTKWTVTAELNCKAGDQTCSGVTAGRHCPIRGLAKQLIIIPWIQPPSLLFLSRLFLTAPDMWVVKIHGE